MSSKTPIIVAAACVFAAAAGYGLYSSQKKAEPAPSPPEAAISAPEPGALVDKPGFPAVALPADATLNGLDGKPHTLDEYKGKLLVVNFWATWCGPCLHEIPALIKLQNDYGAKGLQIVGPAVDDPDAVREQATKLGFNYPVFIGESDAMLDLMTRLGNTSGALPFSVVIDPEGMILERHLGEYSPVELAGLIEEQLAKPASAPAEKPL